MKILMATMSMDIGGAETHVLELCLELLKRGHEIYLASNGGEYIKQLEDAGVKIVWAPLNSNHPLKMFKSYRILNKLLKEQQFDLVHSHTRISSYILGLLQKKYKFPFVTTDHGAFRVSKLLKAMTNWGEVTLAVSNDLKEYLLKNYKIYEEDIVLTVNGIDVEKFNSNVNYEDVLEELKIDKSSFKIVHVSRMDNETTFVTKQLINIVPELIKTIPNLQLIIVGDGTAFAEITEQSNSINQKCGKEIIKLAGKRTDIYKFDAMSSLFVGVSRALLEAMACEKLAVIAGSEGFLGYLNDLTIDDAIRTNFTCRNLGFSSEKSLANSILEAYEHYNSNDIIQMKKNRELIVQMYSIKKMADDAEKAYKNCQKKHKNN